MLNNYNFYLLKKNWIKINQIELYTNDLSILEKTKYYFFSKNAKAYGK